MQGENIDNVLSSEITVMVGSDSCCNISRNDTFIYCTAPFKRTPTSESITVSL